MKTKSTLIASSFLAIALPALSFADSPFNGIQAGVTLGYEDASMDWDTDLVIDAFNPNNVAAPGANSSESLDDSAFAYGVFGSYNMALSDSWILGAELAYQGSDISDSLNSIPGFFLSPSNQTQAEVEVNDTFLLGSKVAIS